MHEVGFVDSLSIIDCVLFRIYGKIIQLVIPRNLVLLRNRYL